MSYALSLQQDLAGGGYICSPAFLIAACIQAHLRSCLLLNFPCHLAPGLTFCLLKHAAV